MFTIILSILMIAAAVIFSRKPLTDKTFINRSVVIALGLFGLFGFLSHSFVIVDKNEVGLLHRIYLSSQLPPGRIIAADGEKGPQAEILGPGFHLMPLVKVLYGVEIAPVIEIREGTYGILVAKDGKSLREGQFLADPWPEEEADNMLNADYFINNGGQKGPQLNVLTPGKYRINPYLWSVEARKALDVPTGTVAVIRSNVKTVDDCSAVASTAGVSGGQVATPIVSRGCIGVWEEPLGPGRYYLNETAYVSTIIPPRLTTWAYKGGYAKRKIDLRVSADGSIVQEETRTKIAKPKSAADAAITVRVEGWEFPVEVRAVVQVHPKDAPRVVASVGDLQAVEDRIVTPTIRDVLRTIGGHPGRKVLDFVEKRDEIVAEGESVVALEAYKAGVTVQELRLGEASVPPELMTARLREQLAAQLKETFAKERVAQQERIKVERERATADQQPKLVEAEIAKQAASHQKEKLRLEGEGEKLKLIEIARGQEALTKVLGSGLVAQLKALEMAFSFAADHPEMVKVPNVLVTGADGGGFEGAAAVLGYSNLVRGLNSNTQGFQNPKAKK